MMVWAIVSAVTACCKDFVGLLLARFFLGVTEAPYYPGAVYLLSIFYTRKEVATRIAILYTGNILATAFAGLIAAGVFHGLDDVRGLHGWQWLFILQGSVTFAVAIVGFFLLPDLPLTTIWLSEEERQFAHRRMEEDTVGNEGQTSTGKGFKQAARDPLVWLFSAMAHMHLAANGFKNFVSKLLLTLLLGLPAYRSCTVPHCGRDTRFWPDRYSCLDLPTISHCRRSYYPCIMVVREVQRAYLAYHHFQGGCHNGLRRCRLHA